MRIYIIGNQWVKGDNLPISLLPRLKKEFPNMVFEEADPNENFIPEDDSIIIDTVVGIDHVELFSSLDAFERTRSVTPHDYDLWLHLALLRKLEKIHNLTIVGVPKNGKQSQVLAEILSIIKNFS